MPAKPTASLFHAKSPSNNHVVRSPHNKVFRFAEKSKIHNINAFTIYSVEGTGCGTADVKYMPRSFRAVLATPQTIDGLPLSEADGQALLKQMTEEGNADRVIYARFNMRITRIEPLRQIVTKSGTRYEQGAEQFEGVVRLNARLDSVDFYADSDRTRLLYHYQP